MSRKSIVKAVIKVETKTFAEEMDGIRSAIESGVVDVQTITTLKKLLSQKTSTASITISTSKSATLSSSRPRKSGRMSTRPVPEAPIPVPFPSTELVSATKTVVMKSLTALATEIESRNNKSEPNSDDSKAKTSLSQGLRNVVTCCKVALESLREWQDHDDIGSTWVNKAYFGYISKLISLEMPDTAIKELTSLKAEIEKKLGSSAPITPSIAARKKLQASTKHNLPQPTPAFDPLPLLLLNPQGIDDEETVLLACAYFNHTLRAIGIKPKYEPDMALLTALEASSGPISWLQKLPSQHQSAQIDHFSRAITKIALNSLSPRIQLSLRTLRHRLSITQSSVNIDNIAKSTYQALRSFYAATKSDKDAYTVCKDTITPILDKIMSTGEGGKIVNFMAVMARKSGLLSEAMKWNDLGLRKSDEGEKTANALLLLRNASIIFSFSKEEIDELSDESIQHRLRYAQNCLKRFDEFETSAAESLRDEVDFLRKAVLSVKSEIIKAKESLKTARLTFPRYLLQAICFLADLDDSLIPKLVIPTRSLIFDLLTALRNTFSPTSPPPTYLAILDLCQHAAIKLQDNQSLQFTGNQYFNCGNAFYKAGLRKEAKNALEKSLELDFSPIPSQTEQTEEEKAKMKLARCRKLEMLGECCGKGEEKDAFALILEALNVHLTSVQIEKSAAVMSLAQIMKKEEYLTRLVGSLTKFSRDPQDWSPGDVPMELNEEFSIVLNEELPAEVRAIVYEIQIDILLGTTIAGQHDIVVSLCHKALQFYEEHDYPLRRARVIERLLYLAVLSGDQCDNPLELGTAVVRILTSSKTFGQDEGLHNSRKLILSRCLAWMGLLVEFTETPNSECFAQTLSIWTRWFEKVNQDAKDEDIGEMKGIAKILDLLNDFFEFKSLSLLRVQALHLHLKLQLHLSKSLDDIIRAYSALALQYLRLGYTGKAGIVFAQALKHMKDTEPSTSIQILWHLSYAEYYARIGSVPKAKYHICQAGEVYARITGGPKKRISANEKAERILAVGKAGFVLSLVAFEENHLEEAIGYIDYAIRVLKTGITAVEKATRPVRSNVPDYDPFSSEPRPQPEKQETTGVQFGSKLWPFKSAFFSALLQHGSLLTFRGSARDGEFWLRQAYDAAKESNSHNGRIIASLHLGDLFTRMSSLESAQEFLSEAAELADHVEKMKESAIMDISFYGFHGRKSLWSDAFRSIIRAESKLRKLLDPGFINSMEKGDAVDWVNRFADFRISLGSPPRAKAASPKATRRSNRFPVTEGPRIEHESITFSRIQLVVAENKGYSLAQQRRFEEGYLAMNSIPSNVPQGVETLSAKITRAKILLLEVYQLLESDPLLCVLSESAISIPSVLGKPTNVETVPVRAKRTRTRAVKTSISATRYQNLLLQSRELVDSVYEQACHMCPSTLTQIVGLILSETRLLTSLVTDPDVDQIVLALKTVMLLDRLKSVSYRREQAALEYENKQDYISLKEIQWPEQSRPGSSDEELTEMLNTLTVASNRRERMLTADSVLQGIPTGCTVVSIYLSESKEHFVFSKVHPQGCVVVRLPLLKHPPEADEEPFTFENAYEELFQIITLNNRTAQAAKHVPDRKAKEEWWNTRKELDARLQLFLENMETCWIGGFTGMFRGFFPNDDLFARFRSTFRQILAKFLPTRREKDAQLELDPRLLDLFLSLTSNKPETESDIADQVEDLLCFALDNFKFHGEPIAIDEVDLDAMTIDVQEAIRCYHEAATQQKPEHIILILDKALHMFPWESLPCLRGKSVSRLPSLSSLMERVTDSPIEGATWPRIKANKGFYVLNPEGDLGHTQSQFENTLSKIQGWSGIVGRAPMSQEILSALRSRDIFLYFGHGSGEQYVKSTQIKRLQNTALTMLFGCSSGKLRDAGDFEPWGTPFTYLLGGSRALLANLWDVTDRDIDRLSYGVFSRWGLCEERPKSRGTADERLEPERAMGLDFGGLSIGDRKKQLHANVKGKKYNVTGKGVSLTEALATAREDCTLKYLNGAAPVIYGVPVLLEEDRL